LRIFASELSKCRKMKFLYGIVIALSFFVIFIIFPLLWFFKAPIPKTTEDYIKEYVVNRLTFTPSTVEEAYFNQYQYQIPLYSKIVKKEIEFIKKNKIYQYVIIKDIMPLSEKNKYLVYVKQVRFECSKETACRKIYESKRDDKIYVRDVGEHKFLLEERKNNG